MQFVIDLDLHGLINTDLPPICIGKTSDPAKIAVIKEVLFAGDQIDADGGAQDGDIDFKACKRIIFGKEEVRGEIRLDPDPDAPAAAG